MKNTNILYTISSIFIIIILISFILLNNIKDVKKEIDKSNNIISNHSNDNSISKEIANNNKAIQPLPLNDYKKNEQPETVSSSEEVPEDNVLSLIEEKYNMLSELSDPIEKRKLRIYISKIKPAFEVIKYTVEKYSTTNDEEKKLHIESIITNINPIDEIEPIKQMASDIQDEALFVSMVYSLRKADTIKSKKALLNLIEQNSLPPNSIDMLTNKQGHSAIVNALSDNVKKGDETWMGKFIEEGASDKQISAIINCLQKIPSEESIDTLTIAENNAQSEELKKKIASLETSMIDQVRNWLPGM